MKVILSFAEAKRPAPPFPAALAPVTWRSKIQFRSCPMSQPPSKDVSSSFSMGTKA